MILAPPQQTIPLEPDASGGLRVAQTRVPLETIVLAHKLGQTPEQIAYSYDTVPLAVVYSIIGYYLSHHEEVESYLLERADLAARTRTECEAQHTPEGIRDRLLARAVARSE